MLFVYLLYLSWYGFIPYYKIKKKKHIGDSFNIISVNLYILTEICENLKLPRNYIYISITKYLKKMYDFVLESSAPILRMAVPDSKVTSLIWGTLDHTIITGHEDGAITQWDLRVRSLKIKCSFL